MAREIHDHRHFPNDAGGGSLNEGDEDYLNDFAILARIGAY